MQVVQGCVEYLHGQRFQDLFAKLVPVFDHPHGKIALFLMVKCSFLAFNVSIPLCPFLGYH